MPLFNTIIGSVVTAKVIALHYDSCDLILPDGEKARLYQQDSLVWKSLELMQNISEYQKGNLIDVFVSHHQHENKAMFFVNERWAKINPWEDLQIKEGDVVEGEILSIYKKSGCFIQLDTDVVLDVNSNINQPDILVYLPISEIPFSDGSVEHSYTTKKNRLELWEGDVVRLEITRINILPKYPEASLIKHINSNDLSFFNRSDLQQVSAHVNNKLFDYSSHQSVPTIPEISKRLLCGLSIVIIDDHEEKLKILDKLLKGNGATVKTVLSDGKKISEIANDIVQLVRNDSYDLILSDYAMPHKNQGVKLIRFVKSILKDMPSINIRYAIISTFLKENERFLIKKELPDLDGCLIRPLLLDQVLNICNGQRVWVKPTGTYDDVSEASRPHYDSDLPLFLEKMIEQKYASFIIILEKTPSKKLKWMYSSLNTPFGESQLEYLIETSDLKTLLENKLPHIFINKKNIMTNQQLCGHIAKMACWENIKISNQSEYIIGVGFSEDRESYYSLIKQLITDKLAVLAWSQWAVHHASFISAGSLVHSLAHEYRNHLNNLSSIGELLSEGVKGNDEHLISEISQDIDEVIDNLKSLTDTLLQGLSQRNKPLELNVLLNYVEKIVFPAFKEYDTELKIYSPPDIMLGIPQAIIVIPLVNLLLNGAKHQYRNNTKRVSLVTVLKNTDRGMLIEFKVCDNGPGIHSNMLNNLYQAGFSDAPKESEQHGIGLWLSSQLLKSVHGTIAISNNYRGLGCCFKITLPPTLG